MSLICYQLLRKERWFTISFSAKMECKRCYIFFFSFSLKTLCCMIQLCIVAELSGFIVCMVLFCSCAVFESVLEGDSLCSIHRLCVATFPPAVAAAACTVAAVLWWRPTSHPQTFACVGRFFATMCSRWPLCVSTGPVFLRLPSELDVDGGGESITHLFFPPTFS